MLYPVTYIMSKMEKTEADWIMQRAEMEVEYDIATAKINAYSVIPHNHITTAGHDTHIDAIIQRGVARKALAEAKMGIAKIRYEQQRHDIDAEVQTEKDHAVRIIREIGLAAAIETR